MSRVELVPPPLTSIRELLSLSGRLISPLEGVWLGVADGLARLELVLTGEVGVT